MTLLTPSSPDELPESYPSRFRFAVCPLLCLIGLPRPFMLANVRPSIREGLFKSVRFAVTLVGVLDVGTRGFLAGLVFMNVFGGDLVFAVG